MTHQPYKHTDLPKAYLTYRIDLDASNGSGLAAFIFDVVPQGYYKISIDNESWYEPHCPGFIRNIIKEIGGSVDSIKLPTFEFKPKFIIKDRLGKEKTIEVQTRQKRRSKDKKKFDAEIRITGENIGILNENIEGLQNLLSEWRIKPTKCDWDTGKKQEVVTLTRKSDIAKREKANRVERKRLLRIQKDLEKNYSSELKDIKDRLSDLEKPQQRKIIREEREVLKGVLD